MSHPIAVFVSGTGRHLENFVRLAQAGELDARVVLVLCDRAGAGAIGYYGTVSEERVRIAGIGRVRSLD